MALLSPVPQPTLPSTSAVAPPPSPSPQRAAQDSNPALVVAIVGIVGTLLAAVITQWLTGRRENRNWSRDQKQEALRWEREREERKEQWEREDAARWHENRMKTYSSFLSRMRDFLYHASLATPGSSPDDNFSLNLEDAAGMTGACDSIRAELASIELLAPMEIQVHSWAFYAQSMKLAVTLHEEAASQRSRREAVTRVMPLLTDIERHYDMARSAIRRDLGLGAENIKSKE